MVSMRNHSMITLYMPNTGLQFRKVDNFYYNNNYKILFTVISIGALVRFFPLRHYFVRQLIEVINGPYIEGLATKNLGDRRR